MEKMLIFDYLNKDTVSTHIEVNRETKEVLVQNFTDDIMRQAIGKNPPTIPSVLRFFERRCFPRTRFDADILLEMLGLVQYSPLDIVLKTHGRMWHDNNWIRFEGENLTWADMCDERD